MDDVNIQTDIVPSDHPYVTYFTSIEVIASLRIMVFYNYRGTVRDGVVFQMSGDQTYSMKRDPLGWNEQWADQWWLGQSIFLHPPNNPGFEGIVKTPELYFTKIDTPILADFESDFKASIKGVAERTEEKLDNFADLDQQTQLLREELSIIVQRGLDQDDPDVKALADFVSSDENLPDASAWAKAEFENALPQTLMQSILDRTTQQIDNLIEKVKNKKNLKPGNDIFAITLEQLGLLKDAKPPLPWYDPKRWLPSFWSEGN